MYASKRASSNRILLAVAIKNGGTKYETESNIRKWLEVLNDLNDSSSVR